MDYHVPVCSGVATAEGGGVGALSCSYNKTQVFAHFTVLGVCHRACLGYGRGWCEGKGGRKAGVTCLTQSRILAWRFPHAWQTACVSWEHGGVVWYKDC